MKLIIQRLVICPKNNKEADVDVDCEGCEEYGYSDTMEVECEYNV